VKGAVIAVKTGIADGILNFLADALDKGLFDALLLPMRVPAGDSFGYVLVKERSLLNEASPFSPVMPIQGAKALSSLTRYGTGTKRIAALLRPCEIRAAVELHKLDQVDVESIFLVSMDCPGVLSLGDYVKDPQKGDAIYERALREWSIDSPRWVCQACDKFSMPYSDVHIGILGAPESSLFLIPGTTKGKNLLQSLDLEYGTSVKSWQTRTQKLTASIVTTV
jgi:formate dehydrogenase subunit beta